MLGNGDMDKFPGSVNGDVDELHAPQFAVSYVAPLPVEGSHVKVGYGVSTAGDNEVGLFRIRFNYAF
jgi:hypothetical protein